jgi:hypothetical protein
VAFGIYRFPCDQINIDFFWAKCTYKHSKNLRFRELKVQQISPGLRPDLLPCLAGRQRRPLSQQHLMHQLTKRVKWINHSTQDSRVVPHRGTNWAALRLTAQIGRDAVLSKSYGRGYILLFLPLLVPSFPTCPNAKIK